MFCFLMQLEWRVTECLFAYWSLKMTPPIWN
jgi:hypothetical protein